MTRERFSPRRRVLGAIAGAISLALAGCLGDEVPGEQTEDAGADENDDGSDPDGTPENADEDSEESDGDGGDESDTGGDEDDGGGDSDDGDDDSDGGDDGTDDLPEEDLVPTDLATGIDVVSAIGAIAENGDEVAAVRLTVKPTPGADDVDLTEFVFAYRDEQGAGTLRHAGEADDGQFGVRPIKAATLDDAVMTDGSDRYELVFPLSRTVEVDEVTTDGSVSIAASGLDALGTGESATVEIPTPDGSVVLDRLQVPDVLQTSNEYVTL